MGKFLMICYVAADFQMNGEVFSVKANQIGNFIEAPAWVMDTLLFKWLVKDGSIKVADETISKKQGENDPMKDMAADGKDEKVAEAAEAEIVEAVEKEKPAEEPAPVKKPRSKKAKKDDAE